MEIKETRWFKVENGKFFSKEPVNSLNEAWTKTFEKWELIKIGLQPDHDITSCGLCNFFFHQYSCGNCSVKLYTKRSGCGGTPYSDWVASNKTSLVAAQLEIEFLQKVKEASEKPLLPEKKEPQRLDPNCFDFTPSKDYKEGLILSYKDKLIGWVVPAYTETRNPVRVAVHLSSEIDFIYYINLEEQSENEKD